MELTEVINREGISEKVPSQHLQINPKQQIVCVGFDFEGVKLKPEVPEGFECLNMGNLTNQGAIMKN